MLTAKLICGDCISVLKQMPENSVDFTFFSPPYPTKTERYPGCSKKMDWEEWVEWMRKVCIQCAGVTSGMCGMVVTNPVVNGQMIPAVERLVWVLHDNDLEVETPVIWKKNSAPNRHGGSKQWFRHSYEQVLFFSKPGAKRTFNWESIAEPPKFSSGGSFRQRNAKGKMVAGGTYPTVKLARPADIVDIPVGGGMMGSDFSKGNEAPYPEKLVEPFLKVLSNPGEIVLDPFSGSATTGSVALKNGRSFTGIDVRPSQIDLGKRRLCSIGIDFEFAGVDARNLKQQSFSFSEDV